MEDKPKTVSLKIRLSTKGVSNFKNKSPSDDETPISDATESYSNSDESEEDTNFQEQDSSSPNREDRNNNWNATDEKPVTDEDANNADDSSRIPCDICAKPILKSHMAGHITQVHSAHKFQCDKCDKILRTEATYKQHVRRDCRFVYRKTAAEQRRPLLKEPEPLSTTENKSVNLTEEGNESNSCAEMQESDDDGKEDNNNSKALVVQGKAKRSRNKDSCKIPCEICGKLISNCYMAEHMSRVHSPKVYHCELCSKTLRTEIAYKHHIMVKHSETSPFECEICKRKLSNRVSLTKHMARFHSSPDKEVFQCDMCSKFFMLKEDLKFHLSCHNTENSFVCGVCGRGFRKKGALSEHEQTHTTEKTFKCLYCDRYYHTKPSMKRHMKSHTEEKRFLCSTCGKSYRVKQSLLKHMIVHTNDRPYKCDQCDKTYRSPNCLSAHKDTHTGIKRWKCIYCNKRFFSEANMYKHRKRHNRVYRHTCEICGKGFIEKQELTSHWRTHQVCTRPQRARADAQEDGEDVQMPVLQLLLPHEAVDEEPHQGEALPVQLLRKIVPDQAEPADAHDCADTP